MDNNTPLEGLSPEGYVTPDTANHDFRWGMLNSGWDAITLAGDVASGKQRMYDPDTGNIDHQVIERAANLAGFMVGGPTPIAEKMANGTLGSFAGIKGAAIFPEKIADLARANELALAGKTADEVWNETGWYRAPDGKAKFEISDENARLKPEAFNKEITPVGDLKWTPEGYTDEIKYDLKHDYESLEKIKLDQVLDHPDLFKAYPELADVNVKPITGLMKVNNPGIKGAMDQAGNTMYLSKAPEDELKSTILHEAQHKIQGIEGFAEGGNQREFLSDKFKDATVQYKDALNGLQARASLNAGLGSYDFWNVVHAAQKELEGKPIKPNGDWSKQTIANVEKAKAAGLYDSFKNVAEAQKLIEKEGERAFESYQKLMGETEARATQARMKFSDIMRKVTPPAESMSVKPEDQIFSSVGYKTGDK